MFILILSGMFGAVLGGAPWWKGAIRVAIGGSLAFALSAGVGYLTQWAGIEENFAS